MHEANTLLFASSNRHKLHEIRSILPEQFNIRTLADIGWTADIPEPYDSFEENAAAKSAFVFERTGTVCFAEDSGLMIDALQGRPGVLSARYAGTHGNNAANIAKVLDEMKGVADRRARFVAVIAFQPAQSAIYFFKGQVEGSIAEVMTGNAGFGYDPIFIPAGFNRSFGDLSPTIKNAISHRSKALHAFADHLKRQVP